MCKCPELSLTPDLWVCYPSGWNALTQLFLWLLPHYSVSGHFFRYAYGDQSICNRPCLPTSFLKIFILLCFPYRTCPWDFPGKNAGVGCHFFLQEIFLTQRLNLHILHWQVDSLPLNPPREALGISTSSNKNGLS